MIVLDGSVKDQVKGNIRAEYFITKLLCYPYQILKIKINKFLPIQYLPTLIFSITLSKNNKTSFLPSFKIPPFYYK